MQHDALLYRAGIIDIDGERVPDGQFEFGLTIRVTPDTPDYDALFKAMIDRKPIAITIQ